MLPTALGDYRYVESGSEDDCSGLIKALACLDGLKCPVTMAKHDRLSREAAYIIVLMSKDVPSGVAALGIDIDRFTLCIVR